MAYMRHSDASQVTADMVDTLARVAGLTLPQEDLGTLAEALGNHLAGFAALDQLALAGINPPLEFDPRWPEVSATPTHTAASVGGRGE